MKTDSPFLELDLERVPLHRDYFCAHMALIAYRGKRYIETFLREAWDSEETQFIEHPQSSTQMFLSRKGTLAVLSFRGTESLKDILTDFSFRHTPGLGGSIHHGMYSALLTVWPQVQWTLQAWLSKNPGLRVWITGHSLGGGLAAFAAATLQAEGRLKVELTCTFGQPAVGDLGFATALKNTGVFYERYVNEKDYVARLPPSSRDALWEHCGSYRGLAGSGLSKFPDPGTNLVGFLAIFWAGFQIVLASLTAPFSPFKPFQKLFSKHSMSLYVRRLKKIVKEAKAQPPEKIPVSANLSAGTRV